MENLIEKMKEIFEMEELDLNQKFTDLEQWDSLSILSVLAMLDSDYKITMNNAKLAEFPTIQSFCDFVAANGQ